MIPISNYHTPLKFIPISIPISITIYGNIYAITLALFEFKAATNWSTVHALPDIFKFHLQTPAIHIKRSSSAVSYYQYSFDYSGDNFFQLHNIIFKHFYCTYIVLELGVPSNLLGTTRPQLSHSLYPGPK